MSATFSTSDRYAARIEILEGEVLELPADARDSEPVRERRVDLVRLLRDALLLVFRQELERAHVVKPVGELDEDDAQVLRHRDEHLAEVLGLLLLGALEVELGDLRDRIHEVRDLGAEALLDLLVRHVAVLRHVVQEARGDRDGVEIEVGEALGDLDAVRDERVAGLARLRAVAVERELEGALEERGVAAGPLQRLEILPQGRRIGRVH